MFDLINCRRTVGITCLGALLASTALAPSAQGATYYACVKKRSGAIRIISRTTRCKRRERRISFNSEGVPGRNGRNGSNGRNGINGRNGTNGINGANGATGFTSTLPKGSTETGTWAIALNSAGGGLSSISFNIPLAAAPSANLIAKGGSATPACPGSAAAPSASSGNLCIYTSTSEKVSKIAILDPAFEGGHSGSSSQWGALVSAEAAAPPALAYGTWAVTG